MYLICFLTISAHAIQHPQLKQHFDGSVSQLLVKVRKRLWFNIENGNSDSKHNIGPIDLINN